jgi:hypothetical protein
VATPFGLLQLSTAVGLLEPQQPARLSCTKAVAQAILGVQKYLTTGVLVKDVVITLS